MEKHLPSSHSFPQLTFSCPEKWDTMTPSGNGRHCSKCDKVVTDFSAMSNEEIQKQLVHSSSENSCGSFMAHQLTQPFGDRRDKLIRFYQRSISFSKNKSFSKSIRLGLAMTLLFITGCYRRSSGYRAQPSFSHKVKNTMQHNQHNSDSIHHPKKRIRTTF